MQYTSEFVSAIDIERPRPEAENDDIDRLFGKLQKVEPPTSLVSDILSSISRLPKDIHTSLDAADLKLEDYTEKRTGSDGGKKHRCGPVVKKNSDPTNQAF